jgi:outer membrane protein OmpA-like peptidoglycan-associated protein
MKNLLYLAFILFAPFSFGQQIVSSENDSLRIEIEKLPQEINSQFNDYAPVITADGVELFFTSRRPITEKEKKKNTDSRENIYHSTFNDSTKKWSNAQLLPLNINVPGRYNSNIAISNDGQRLLIYQDDHYGNGNIHESLLKGSSWSDPVSLSSIINSDAHESSASIAPDGRTIYYVSERAGGRGKRDIWICTKDSKGGWNAPENLSEAINTPEDEESVFIHPDGVTLYFSSKGHNSIGGFDVFKSTYHNKKWSTPVSLGQPINTIGDDLFFVLTASGQTGYYASSRDGSQKDIYEIRFIPKGSKPFAEEPKLTVLKGVIRDAKTLLPLEAKIQITDNSINTVIAEFNSNSESGKYLIPLPAGKNYGISVSATGYLFHSENVDIPDTARFQEIVRDIDLKRLEKGTQIVLRNIFFDLDKYSLKPESETELLRVYQLMIDNPKLIIELSGHTDTQGSAVYNQQLSENRAKTVVEYLTAKGIPANRFEYKGYGEEKPIISDTEIGKMKTQDEKDKAHAFNRRTEFKIISN